MSRNLGVVYVYVQQHISSGMIVTSGERSLRESTRYGQYTILRWLRLKQLTLNFLRREIFSLESIRSMIMYTRKRSGGVLGEKDSGIYL